MDYDTWIFTTPWDADQDDCGCDDFVMYGSCTCAEDAENERGDALFHAKKDNENE